jgi:hypothetical protein
MNFLKQKQEKQEKQENPKKRKHSQVEGSEVEDSEVEGSQVEGSQVEGSQVEGSQVEGSQVEGSQVEDSEVEGSQVEGSQVEDSEVEGLGMIRQMKDFINSYLSYLSSLNKESHPINKQKSEIIRNRYSKIFCSLRTSKNSQKINKENSKKINYINHLLECLKKILKAQGKHIIKRSLSDDTIGFYILDSRVTKEDLQELLNSPDENGETIGKTPKAVISFGKITPSDRSSLTTQHYKKIGELKKIMELDRLHVGWVNGEEKGMKLLGTIAMFYGILKLILEQNTIMFGELDDDSDRSAYTIFGFKYVNQNSKLEASADFTNFEEMIEQVTSLICRIYPTSCKCFEKAKRDFEGTRGGKRRTKKRTKRKNSKKRKTKRRKY